MSEFFNVSLQKDIILDDSQIKNNMTWSSKKIHEEIINTRLTKFEELEDVDVVNKKNKQLVAYSGDTKKFTTIDGIDIEGLAGMGLKQINKMGIVGSPEKPREIHIPINTVDFKVPRVNILKYDLGTQDIITTKNDFSNSEINDFKKNKFIEFDGTAHLKTSYKNDYYNLVDTGLGVERVTDLDLDIFKKIESFDEGENGIKQTLNINAIPHDQILIPLGDINLSNVKHIDYFKIASEGKNIKILISADGGKTWKAFKNEKWINAQLTVESMKENGISPDVFNKINDTFWNELITTKKVRFAYLLCMDNIEDKENIDKLDLQFDGEGRWIQVKESEYEIIYESNTILTVLIKFDGDIKINY
ncbi:signal peptidase II [Clostridium botulinum]|uniref:signal peptidase II n=1 Tax=Clostridium botulinum TaxID=1491 RepID=UPI0013F81D58|nr:signal peptidase II [Clostridium botulinum]MCD3217499.1 signal peptidase II [Clostridium botulinum C]NFV47520.1 signal peptidase II [Clostridium botulinum]